MIRKVLYAVLVSVLIAGCSSPVEKRNRESDRYSFAASMLDYYFLFREKLPENLYAFLDPEALYFSVDEPFTVYYPPEIGAGFLGSLTTATSGAGMKVFAVSSGYVVENVYPDAPAEECGLKVGDTITHVDGNPAAGVSEARFSEMLSGYIGETAGLTLKRGSDVLTKTLTFAIYSEPSVFFEYIDSSTAYIQITNFFDETSTPGGTEVEFASALDSTSDAENLILDLRNNGGGYIAQCLNVVSYLVEPGTDVINTFERHADDEYVMEDSITYTTESGGGASDRKLFVLMNEWTASASEILIACVKSARSDVVAFGTHTYGKARGQVYAVGPDSCVAKVTCQIFWPVSGAHYDLTGIKPDVAVGSEDALNSAYVYISGSELAKSASAGKIQNINEAYRTSFDSDRWKPLAVEKHLSLEK
ncbi:MAG: S41 family peptidase [Chitinispirillaceae bacterium]